MLIIPFETDFKKIEYCLFWETGILQDYPFICHHFLTYSRFSSTFYIALSDRLQLRTKWRILIFLNVIIQSLYTRLAFFQGRLSSVLFVVLSHNCLFLGTSSNYFHVPSPKRLFGRPTFTQETTFNCLEVEWSRKEDCCTLQTYPIKIRPKSISGHAHKIAHLTLRKQSFSTRQLKHP